MTRGPGIDGCWIPSYQMRWARRVRREAEFREAWETMVAVARLAGDDRARPHEMISRTSAPIKQIGITIIIGMQVLEWTPKHGMRGRELGCHYEAMTERNEAIIRLR